MRELLEPRVAQVLGRIAPALRIDVVEYERALDIRESDPYARTAVGAGPLGHQVLDDRACEIRPRGGAPRRADLSLPVLPLVACLAHRAVAGECFAERHARAEERVGK